MKRGAILGPLLALGLAAPGSAQDGDRARLDDFAVPQASAGAAIEQVDSETSRITAEQATPADRELAVPGPAAAERAPLPQLSRRAEGGTTRQLSDSAQSREVASGSVSTSRDSRPQPATAIAGSDRCDPGAGAAKPECARILERRAAEFAAAEPPRLSAEQVLLAASEKDDGALAANSSRVRLRLASNANPDAELQSNQELAAIYLRRTGTDQPQQPEDRESAEDASIAEVLRALQISVPGAPAP